MNSRFLHSLIALAVMASVAMAAPFDDLQDPSRNSKFPTR